MTAATETPHEPMASREPGAGWPEAFYVFDSLSDLQVAWSADLAHGIERGPTSWGARRSSRLRDRHGDAVTHRNDAAHMACHF